MSKISLYLFLILLYLGHGLSGNLNPLNKTPVQITENNQLPTLFLQKPVSVILIDAYSIGFFVKSYYLTFKVVSKESSPRAIHLKTSWKYWKYLQPYLGLSIFRRYDNPNSDLSLSYTPAPPGVVFIGDFSVGRWKNYRGKKRWFFYRSYKHFPELFGWGELEVTTDFFSKVKESEAKNTPFSGDDIKFGVGSVNGQKIIVPQEDSKEALAVDIKGVLARYFNLRDLYE